VLAVCTGLDVHKRYPYVAVVDETGEIAEEKEWKTQRNLCREHLENLDIPEIDRIIQEKARQWFSKAIKLSNQL